MPLILFSQIGIDSIPTNKVISLTLAREIVKDLARCDSMKLELDIVNSLASEVIRQSTLKDSIITIYKEKEFRYLDFIKNQMYLKLDYYEDFSSWEEWLSIKWLEAFS